MQIHSLEVVLFCQEFVLYAAPLDFTCKIEQIKSGKGL